MLRCSNADSDADTDAWRTVTDGDSDTAVTKTYTVELNTIIAGLLLVCVSIR